MAYRDFVSLIHKSTKRDYVARVTQRDKAEVAELALKWEYDYWDGSRETGYGGCLAPLLCTRDLMIY